MAVDADGPDSDPVDGSQLCLECGLCCNGTLFSHLPIPDHEAVRVAALGAQIETRVNKDGKEFRALVLGCSLLEGRCCSVYDQWRPGGCGAFACQLLKNFREGKRSLDESIEIVREFEAAVVDAAEAEARQAGPGAAATADADRFAIGLSDAIRTKYF